MGHFGATWGRFGAAGTDLKQFGGHFWPFWGNLVFLRPFWGDLGSFGAIWGCCRLEMVRGHFGAILVHFGPFWSILVHLSPFSGPFRIIFGHFGPFWSILVHLSPFSGHFRITRGHFEAISVNFGAILAHFHPPWCRFGVI